MRKNSIRIISTYFYSPSNNKGFTLVEVLIVVGIIAILSAIAIPAYRNYITTSKRSAAQAVLEQFPVLVETYRAENGMMCPTCNATNNYTYTYTEDASGAENTVGNKITDIYPDFRAKGVASNSASLYHYQVVFTVAGCPNCTESAVVTAQPQAGRGAPPGNIVGDTYR